MAVTVWTSGAARPAHSCKRASGVEVSVAVWKDGTDYSLRFKRSTDGGTTWPADEAATVIGSLTKREPWFIQEVGPLLVAGNGLNRQFHTQLSGDTAADWSEA